MIMQYDIGEEKNLREINKNQFIAIFAVILIITVVFLTFNLTRETCGNSICRGDENCFYCPKDCKCEVEEYCSAKEKKCIKPTCGDRNCEKLENCSGCPVDCGTCPVVSFCGDGKCDKDETCSTCPKDCGICKPTHVCGNNICELEENCYDCPKDCKCGEGEYCYSKEKKCIKPTCGDGKCEPYEDQYNCCLDCKCILPSEICNEETKKCEIQEMNISDKRVVELIIAYFKELNMEINSTEITGIGSYYEKLVKIVKVQISGEEWFRYIGVTENGEIIELPIL